MVIFASICFFALHGGPADHFATYGEALEKEERAVHYYAAGPAYKTLKNRAVEEIVFVVEADGADKVADQLIKRCAEPGSMLITDMGHPFSAKLQAAIKKQKPELTCIGYYDNPEPFVPGGYSHVVAQVCDHADWVLFANKALTATPIYKTPGEAIDLPFSKRRGVGYYPLEKSEKIKRQRLEKKDSSRKALFEHLQREDKGEKILVYAGGNNEVYFEKALPAFLSMICETIAQGHDLSDLIIVFQQHPGAKIINRDLKLVDEKLGQIEEKVSWIASPFSTDQAFNFADSIWYYQTSMSPLFALADIPAVQVGHEVYEDLLVRNQLCDVVYNKAHFLKALQRVRKGEHGSFQEEIHQALGTDPHPMEQLKKALGIYLPSLEIENSSDNHLASVSKIKTPA